MPIDYSHTHVSSSIVRVDAVHTPIDPSGGGGVEVDNGVDAPAAVTSLLLPSATFDGDTASMAPVVIAASNPGAIGAGFLWLEHQADGNSYQLWVRDAANVTWLQASAGLSVDNEDRQVGHFNSEYFGVHGLEVQPSAHTVLLRAISEDGNDAMQIRIEPTQITLPGSNILTFNFPSVDPGIAGQLYTDGVPSTGVPKALMVSGG